MRGRATKHILLLSAALLVAALAVPEAAGAQCALCKLTAASGGPRAVRALAVGVVVLLVPPVAIFCTIFVAAYRRGREGEEHETPPEG